MIIKSLRHHVLVAISVAQFALIPLFNEANPAQAETKTDSSSTNKGPIIATVNGSKIYQADVEMYQRNLPPEVAQQINASDLVNAVISNRLILEKAKKSGIENKKQIKAAMAEAAQQASNQVMINAWLTDQVRDNITAADIKTQYNKDAATYKPQPQVDLNYIVVATQADADQIIKDLNNGAKFADLAKQKSKDPSAGSNNGHIGYVFKTNLPPNVGDAVFALNDGQYTKTALQTPNGWNVFMVSGHKMSTMPTLEQATPVIRDQLAQAYIRNIVVNLRQNAKVVFYNQDGTPVQPSAPVSPLFAPEK